MSPTPKNDSPEAAEAVLEAPAPRKRGRPRKNPEPAPAEVETTAAEAGKSKSAAAAVEEAAPAKPKRGRKPRAETTEEAPEATEAAATPAEPAEAPAEEPASKKGPKKAAESGEEEELADDADGKDGDGRRGRNRGRNRSSRTPRKAPLNFRDLQSKIIPELHLLAKEVGLEEYRQMEKDDLAVAILERASEAEGLRLVRGYLEISSDGYGFLQESLLQNNTRSVIVSAGLIKQFRLRTGDYIMGKARRPRDNERYGTLIRVEAVNNVDPFQASKRPRFEELTPTFPEQHVRLETTGNELSTRVIDLLAPIGRGQRGLIVAPPKAGKTTLLKKIANAVVANEPDIKVIVLLVDERPEEVTDFRESVQGVEVVASTFDEPPSNHIRVAEFVHESARRIVEDSGHVMILLDSITRLARANNLVTPPTGRTLSGGLDSNALHWPKRFLGAARNIRGGGSLSILATALVETGSRMDDVIFEEFKGTGNMELHLSRHLEERRIFPAIDILKSGTRREDLLLGEDVLAKMWLLRKVISDMDPAEAMEMLLGRLGRTKSNAEFLSTLTQG
jgi:transcription termination factor Rho